MIPLPPYIDPEAWAGFVAMRKSMPKSKPFTDRAAMLILKRLMAFKAAGHDPNASLDQSTMMGWAGVFEPKDEAITTKASSEADKTAAYLAEQRAHAAQSRIRRVA
jgi:hypothetical protein